jgi:hypothetical protein
MVACAAVVGGLLDIIESPSTQLPLGVVVLQQVAGLVLHKVKAGSAALDLQ